jgi:excisionase family DNA binding protein
MVLHACGANRLETHSQPIGVVGRTSATLLMRERERAMRKAIYTNPTDTPDVLNAPEPPANGGLPNRLLTAFEVAEFVGCHEETVRRAYLRGLLASQRFGVRGRRFNPADVLDWIRRGAPTKVS